MTLEKILAPLMGEFMSPVVEHGKWIAIDGSDGITLVPADVIGDIGPEDNHDANVYQDYYEGKVYSVEELTGYAARLSASGYMDCTEWMGVYDTAEEAARELVEAYAPE